MAEIIFDADEDWKKRTLCSDESCIGTIGHNGRCKECGKVYEGKSPQGHDKSSTQPTTAQEQQVSVDDAESDDDWEKRVLCSDEACIGVIGSEGKCKECGRPGGK